MKAFGARAVTALVLLAGTVVAAWQLDRFRADYWAQLSPWVTVLAGAFAYQRVRVPSLHEHPEAG